MRVVVVSFVFLCCASSFAESHEGSKTRYYRHEVSVGIGRIGVQSAWSDDYEKSVMSRFGLVVGQCTDWFVI